MGVHNEIGGVKIRYDNSDGIRIINVVTGYGEYLKRSTLANPILIVYYARPFNNNNNINYIKIN